MKFMNSSMIIDIRKSGDDIEEGLIMIVLEVLGRFAALFLQYKVLVSSNLAKIRAILEPSRRGSAR